MVQIKLATAPEPTADKLAAAIQAKQRLLAKVGRHCHGGGCFLNAAVGWLQEHADLVHAGQVR